MKFSHKPHLGGLALACTLALLTSPAFGGEALDLLQDNTDGTVGVYLKEVNGSVRQAHNESTIFEGASTNKTMIHVRAMLEIMDGTATSGEMIPVATDLVGSCPQGTGVVMESLADALRLMMQDSDNARTQAVRDRFGDTSINDTMQTLGMTDSLLNSMQTLGCGDEALQDPNELTAVDLGQLYEQVLSGFLDETTRDEMFDLMLNETNSFFINSIVDQEALAAGASAAEILTFKSQIRMAHKGGSYTLIPAGQSAQEYRSLAGYVEMPFACDGQARQFTYVAFVDNAGSLDTQGTGNDLSIFDAARELLRPVIRDALDSAVCARAPEVVAPAAVTLECNSSGGIDATDSQVTSWLGQSSASDECDTVDVVNDAPSFFPSACAPGQRTHVVFSATDSCGSEGTAISSVSVQDTTAPTLMIPSDQTVECASPDGTDVDVIASASDVCSSVALSNSETGAGADASGTFALGDTTVAWDAVDDCNNHSCGWTTITVEDTTDPVVTCGVEIDTLWPPNHQFVDVGLWYDVGEECDPNPTVDVSVTSDEHPATAPGAGGPIQCPDAHTCDGAVQLRAESSGNRDGRVYVITVTVTDASGNVGTCQTSVGVPHDMGNGSTPVDSGQDYDPEVCAPGNSNGNGNGNGPPEDPGTSNRGDRGKGRDRHR
jgi:hypothetical protein